MVNNTILVTKFILNFLINLILNFFINFVLIFTLAINKLPIIQKQRIIYYYFNNLTEVEIEEKYSISQKNVSVSLFKAKENLKRILKKFN